ncbi:HprK-related kinase B [bacterium]|nr:HprK-related kinase B [bacterium]
MPTVLELTSQLRRDFAPSHELALRFGSHAISVKTNSSALRQRLSDYFQQFHGDASVPPEIEIVALEGSVPKIGEEFTIKTPDPGKTKIKEEFLDCADGRIVRKRLTGMMLLFGNGINVAVGPCEANDNQVVNFINNRYIEHLLLKGCLLGHAAGVVYDGCGLALAGFSGMGKSTLALHLMSRDLCFVSNDRLLVCSNTDAPLMHGVPKQPRINPGTAMHNPDLRQILPAEVRSRLSAMSTDELWELEQKYDVMIDDTYGEDRFVLEAPMNALVILNWQRTGKPTDFDEVDPGERRDLLAAFVKDPGLFFDPPPDVDVDLSQERYLEVLSYCRVFEVTGGVDFETAADHCMRVLREAASAHTRERSS